MNYFYLFLWMLVDNFINVSTSSCLMHDKCLEDLRHFSHADEFYVYLSLEDAEDACSKAKDAYLCVAANPECRHPAKMAKMSPILKGSFRLLNEFCGFRSKRRPCCALRTAYLEHSACYEEVSERLTDCNDKYRVSLEKILTIEDQHLQNKQRFCSVKWLGNCVKAATNSYCGKVAAQVIRTYFTKAGKPEKIFLEENTECDESLYGYEEDRRQFCGEKRFYKCLVHLFFLHEYLVEDRLTEEEAFLSICVGIHDSLECLYQAYKRCIFSQKTRKFERLELDDMKNEACVVQENVMQRYIGNVHCLSERIQQLTQCEPEFDISPEFITETMPYSRYNDYFCGVLKKLETCWINKAFSLCGKAGKEVMTDIIGLAAIKIHPVCKLENPTIQ